MNKNLSPILSIAVFVLIFAGRTFAQDGLSPDGVWRAIDESSLARPAGAARIDRRRAFRLDKAALKNVLDRAPREFASSARASAAELTLPLPDGRFARFAIEDSPVFEEGFAARYPNFKTYVGRGLDDPSATVRLSYTPTGFRAQILTAGATVLIDPAAAGETNNYISFAKAEAEREGDFVCLFDDGLKLLSREDLDLFRVMEAGDGLVTNGATLRTYRLAVAATAEYVNVFRQTGDTDAQAKTRALEQQVLIMNRVNGVYERDLAVRMVIVANNDLLIYTDAATDPYTNTNGSTMLGQNQTNIDTVIGTANYDIGHVFSTGGGGVATLNSPCNPTSKARGVTGLTNPVGDPFAIDYVAHEMGHQFGGRHTFNGAVSNCGGNRSSVAAYEPGSGVTIMGYAGICGTQDLARNSIDTFHVKSLEEIVAFITNTSTGDSCPVRTATGNTPPAISIVGGPGFNIPKNTPFALTAAATDTNGDTVTYDWQQYDLGASTTAVPNTDSDGTARPIFRSYLPTAGGTRFFPSAQYVLANANVPPATFSCGRATPCLTGELLPAITRTMTFQAIARDNRAGGGGINTATATVSVDGNSGPFAVTAPNTNVTITVSDTSSPVTWNVAGSNAAPVSAANVRILASTDGGQTYPYVLAASTPNDGSEQVFFPAVNTTTARVKIEAVGNIFFDVSDTNFTIQVSLPPGRPKFDFDGDGRTDVSIYRPAQGQWWINNSGSNVTTATTFGTATDTVVPADYSGDGKTDLAFFRPSTGEWFILRSENGTFYSFPFGAAGDIPAPGDFDGDGKADAAVYRPSAGIWFIARSTGGVTIQPFGIAEDKPIVADYDADGKDDVAVFRPSLSQWWILRSTAGLVAVQFGQTGDRAVPADFTGDGRADLALWRPSNGNWFVLRSENGSFYAFPFGASGDVPVPGDYDGDNRTDAAVFRPSGSTWFLNRSSSGTAITPFGAAGDSPIPSAYVR